MPDQQQRSAVRQGEYAVSTSPPALLRASEAAHYLSLSRSKLYALIQTGELEAVHVGRCMRLRRNTLDEFIDQLGE